MQPDDISKSIRALIQAAMESSDALSARVGRKLEYTHIEQALVETLRLDSSVELLRKNLTAEAVTSLLKGYDFNRLFPQLIEIISLSHSIIPDETPRKLTEVTIRSKGEVWRIYQNDADPWPSNPHAHNLESGLKLHLGTGELFRGSRFTGHKISAKSLDEIRARLSKFNLPPVAC